MMGSFGPATIGKITRTAIAGLALACALPAPASTSFRPLVDEIARLGAESAGAKPKISRCAAFAHLFAELYEIDGEDAALTLGDAALFLGDTSVIYSKLGDGSKKLALIRGKGDQARGFPSPWAPLARKIVRVLARRMNESAIIPALDVAQFESWSNSNSSFHGLARVNDAKLRAIRALVGESDVPRMPSWLSEHGAGGPGSKDPAHASNGDQDLAHGYLQLVGDDDGTGRHDHFIGNAIVGYASESFAVGSLLYVPTARAATYIDEFLAADQNKSPTDYRVNNAGLRFGKMLSKLERKGMSLSSTQLERTVFAGVCDESVVQAQVSGPLLK